MTIRTNSKKSSGITLVEALVIIAVGTTFAALYLPNISSRRSSQCYLRTKCANNLKQVAGAFRMWAGDNGDRFPMDVPMKEGGTKEFAYSPDVFRHFQVIANEFGNAPKVLVCPADDEATPAPLLDTNSFFRNTNLSYFIGLEANDNFPQRIQAGDHNLSDTDKIQHGLFARRTNQFVKWTPDMHTKQNSSGAGNLMMADGSVQQPTSAGLRKTYWQNTGIPINRLALP
jgi:hypothetical protein